MATFICLLEFEGGIYVSKVTAKNHDLAVRAWVSKRLPCLARYIGKVCVGRIKRSIAEDRENFAPRFPTLLDGLPEVAYISVWHSKRYSNYMHIVKCT